MPSPCTAHRNKCQPTQKKLTVLSLVNILKIEILTLYFLPMRLFRAIILIFMLGLATATMICASEEVLTISMAVERAFERNPEIQNQRERILESQSSASYAFSQAFPRISAKMTANEKKAAVNTGSATFGGEPYNQYIGQIDLTQPLYASGALTSATRAAEKNTQIREFDLEIAKRDLILNVFQAFYSILLNEKLLSIYREAEEIQKESLAISRRYQKSGRGQLIDVYQNETQLAQIAPKIVRTENQVKASEHLLATLLHSTDLSKIHAKGQLTVIDRSQIDRIFENNKRERFELLRQSLTLEEFRFNRTIELASNYPNLDLIGNIARTTTDKSELLDSNSTSWSIGLQLTIPIFTGLSSLHQRSILNAQEAQLKHQEVKLKDQLSLEEIQAITNLNNAETVLLASQKAADFSKKALLEAKKGYRLQTIGPFQFLLISQSYLDAQSEGLTAKYSYLTSLVQYFVAFGVPLSILVDLLEQGSS